MCVSSEPCQGIEELVDTGVDRALRTLHDLGVSTIRHARPQVIQGLPEQVLALMPEGQGPLEKLVMLEFGGGLAGRAVLALPHDGASQLATLLCHLAHLDNPSDAERDELLEEVANLLLNGLVGSLANTMSISIVAPVPQVIRGQSLQMVLAAHWSVAKNPDDGVFLAVAPFQTEDATVRGALVLLFDPATLLKLLDTVKPAGV